MHRTINIKHRIVRRVDIGKAPLATFDTIDLGDEDIKSKHSATKRAAYGRQQLLQGLSTHHTFDQDGSLKTETIGGNNSKKSLSQAGGEDKDATKDIESAKNTSEAGGEVKDVGSGKEADGATKTADSRTVERSPEIKVSSDPKKIEGSPGKPSETAEDRSEEAPAVASRQGTLGRVNIPIRKQNSDSSSSSGSGEEQQSHHFTFQASRPSIGHFDATPDQETPSQEAPLDERDSHCTLLPDNIDPSQILSPSKRKAYERRIERLKVTTSPIARPRSTAPISVVTLDEYANISSPENSPASPSILQDKLKITLPPDEFTSKPKTPRLHSARRKDSDDTCFEFTEEILFSRSKSALVVEEDGLLPPSPRRVLIPPTLTPTSSPKLSSDTRLSSESLSEEAVGGTTPKLIYIQHNKAAHKIFGDTVDETDEDNWASFPDSSVPDGDKSEFETAEKEELKEARDSVVCELEKGLPDANASVSHSCSVVKGTGLPAVGGWDTSSETAVAAESEVSFDLPQNLSETVTISEGGEAFLCGTGSGGDAKSVLPDTDNNELSYSELAAFVEPAGQESAYTTGVSQDLLTGHGAPYLPHPEYETEEILMVEIHEAAEGCEKRIEIDVRSSNSSGSLTPEGPDATFLGSLGSKNLAAVSGNSLKPVPDLNIQPAVADIEHDNDILVPIFPPQSVTGGQQLVTNASSSQQDVLDLNSVPSQSDTLSKDEHKSVSLIDQELGLAHSQNLPAFSSIPLAPSPAAPGLSLPSVLADDPAQAGHQDLDECGLGLLQPFSNPVCENLSASSDLIDFSSSLDDPSVQ
ncbi:uncharacterized protein LOC101853482 [Aplysia californica]|uniref:Uncharacterized protein LOC101853482 n=1 Tax=Aplysia californica TaxID=6500 RepID=A0ABM1A6X5_APLCA|nr:uncharacterized protein LOC101853482 [Aplysia californica]XP_012942019.1 uncharacterized protein LOC101853482 [Aplysia californica]